MNDLPQELVSVICSYCDYSTNFSLRWVCKRMIRLVKLPPIDKIRKSLPRILLDRELMVAVATVDGNYSITKWLRGLGYPLSDNGTILVGTHCDDQVIKYYCNGSKNRMRFADVGKIFSGKIPVATCLSKLTSKAALRGGNVEFLMRMDMDYSTANYLFQQCIKWNDLNCAKILSNVCNTHMFTTDGISVEMYQLLLDIRPDRTEMNYELCRTHLHLMEQHKPHIDVHHMTKIVNRIQYNPLLLVGDREVTDIILHNLVRSIYPRVHYHYKSRIITDKILLIKCGRISWIRKYFHTALGSYSNDYYIITSLSTNNYQIIRYLLDEGIMYDSDRSTHYCNDPDIARLLPKCVNLHPTSETSHDMHQFLIDADIILDQCWIRDLMSSNDTVTLEYIQQYKCFRQLEL